MGEQGVANCVISLKSNESDASGIAPTAVAGGGANVSVAGNIIVGTGASINGETNGEDLAGNMADRASRGAETALAERMHKIGAITEIKQLRSTGKNARNVISFVRPVPLK